MRTIGAFLATMLAATNFIGSSHAANFTVESEQKFGAWASVYYRNLNGGRFFCALEAYDGSKVFRLSRYIQSREIFIEIYDSSWDLIEGQARFTLDFNGKEAYSLELKGTAYKSGYTYDILEKKNYELILALLATNKTVSVKNSNHAELASFNLVGSAKSIMNYLKCPM